MEHFLQSQPNQDATPLDEQEPSNKLASNQQTGPTTLLETRIADASPLTDLNPNVDPYEPPTTNDSRQIGQAQPNLSTNAAQLSTSDVENPSILRTHLTALTKLVESQAQSRLPLPKPDVFSGDPLKFPVWLKAFETLIETRAVNPIERLHFLGRYVGGEAKELRRIHADGWRRCVSKCQGHVSEKIWRSICSCLSLSQEVRILASSSTTRCPSFAKICGFLVTVRESNGKSRQPKILER